MIQISLDTSFLISFADPDRSHHGVALEYFRHCLANRIPMWISTIAAGEFEVGQPVTDLPLQTFRIQPYNLPHAIKAASLYNALKNEGGHDDGRKIIINDLKGATYYGRLIISVENELQQRKVLELDARPSDCIAMASLQNAPIYITKNVWDEVEDMSEVLEGMENQGGEPGNAEG